MPTVYAGTDEMKCIEHGTLAHIPYRPYGANRMPPTGGVHHKKMRMIHVPLRLWREQTGTMPAALPGGGYRMRPPRAADPAARAKPY